MKFKIKKELLLDALNKVSKAISTKNLIPVLAGIKFELKKKKLVLTATDNDITIQTTIDVVKEEDFVIESEGSIIIQGKYILDIVRKLPDEFINIEVIDELKIIIYTDNSEFNLNGINKNEYPNITLEQSKKVICINNKDFRNIINQTAFATSSDEARPVLTGINFKIVGDILECNATDSYRLAKKTIKLGQFAEENYNFVVPSKNLIEFNKILDYGDNNIELHIFNNKILFKYNNLLFQSRLINGNYPNTTNLWPTDAISTITANLDELYNVIDRASILTSDKEKNIVTFEVNDDTLLVKSSSAEIGRVEEKMKVERDNQENIKISFSAKYMMDALKSFDGGEAKLSFFGEVKPIIVRNTEDETVEQLVLPIRTY